MSLESRVIQTQNCAPIQCRVWPRIFKNCLVSGGGFPHFHLPFSFGVSTRPDDSSWEGTQAVGSSGKHITRSTGKWVTMNQGKLNVWYIDNQENSQLDCLVFKLNLLRAGGANFEFQGFSNKPSRPSHLLQSVVSVANQSALEKLRNYITLFSNRLNHFFPVS